jgi:hypothetical protein
MRSSLIGAMTREHPRWREFCNKLEKSLNKKGCEAGTDKSQTQALLIKMGLSWEAAIISKAYFDGYGGYCDCEILMNVDRAEPEAE